MFFNKEIWQVYNTLLFPILISYLLLLVLSFQKYHNKIKWLGYPMILITKNYGEQDLWKLYFCPNNGSIINIIRDEFHGKTRETYPYQNFS